jgi:transcriptional regulator with XRE-family HTH domain
MIPEMTTDQAENWYSEQSATFGDRLAGAREAAGLTQADLARRLGVRLKTLRAWENDVSAPRANRLTVLAGIVNVSMVWLLTGEGDGISVTDVETAQGGGDLTAALLELRQLRAEAGHLAEGLARLEKRLRVLTQGGGQ